MTIRLVFTAGAIVLAMPFAAFAQEAPVIVEAPDDARLSLAREVISLGFPEETRMDSMVGVADQLIEQLRATNGNGPSNPQVDAVMDRFVQRVLDTTRTVLGRHIDDMMEGMAIAYADTFTYEELLGIRDFVASPAGRGFLTRVTDINAHPAYASATQAYMDEYMSYMPQLQRELMRDLTAALESPGSAKGQ